MLSLFNPKHIGIQTILDLESVQTAGDLALASRGSWLISQDSRDFSASASHFRCDGGNEPSDNAVFTFLALSGQRDGHDFMLQALAAGCKIFLLKREKKTQLFDQYPFFKANVDHKTILVLWLADPLDFIWRIAAKMRQAYTGRVVAVTGSNGKTSFKQILAALLEPGVHVTAGNYNNEIGLPLTILSLPNLKIPFLLLEMGMNHEGEIERLSLLSQPHLAVITSIGHGHIGNFGSTEKIAYAKAEILHGLKKNGHLFVSGHSKHLDIITNQCKKHQVSMSVYGLDDQNDIIYQNVIGQDVVRLKDLRIEGCRIDADSLSVDWDGEELRLPMTGRHQLINFIGALTVAHYLGQNLVSQKDSLARLKMPQGRMQHVNFLGIHYIVDCYNANPESMQAGIDSMVAIAPSRIIWLLGDMKELGALSALLHHDLGKYVANKSRDQDWFIAYGDFASQMIQGWQSVKPVHFAHQCLVFNSAQQYDLRQQLAALAQAPDYVYVKGSRSMAMEKLLPFSLGD